METETLINKYINECFEKTDNENDILKFETIWRCLCSNPEYFNELIKHRNVVTKLNNLLEFSGQLHSNYLRGWRVSNNV